MKREKDYWRRRIFHHIFCWIYHWIAILDSIVGILTLGFYNPMLSYKAVYWISKTEINWRKRKESKI